MQELLRHSMLAINVGYLHAGSHSGETAAQAAVVSLVFSSDTNEESLFEGQKLYITTNNKGDRNHSGQLKKGAKRARNVPFLRPRWFQ